MTPPVGSAKDREVLRSFARRIDPSDPGAHNNLGVFYYQKGLVEDAIAAFQRALELDPKMQVAQRNLEIAYEDSGYYDRRIAELKSRLKAQPDDRDAHWELGRTYASLGQYDAAVDEFEALVARHPRDVAVLLQLGLAEKNRGNLEAATEWLRRARELDQDSSVVHQYLGEVLYNRGLNTDACEALERAVALNPENADAHYQLAFVYGDVGRHEEARAATKRAIQLNPTFARAQTNLTLERFRGPGREDDRVGEPATPAVAEESALAHYNLGLAFRQKGYYAEALREYRLALDRGEDRELVLQAVAEVHLLRRDYAAALELYDQLVEEFDEVPKLWNERGVVLHQMGRFDEAIASYRRAHELRQDYALALNNLGITLAQIGQQEEAVELLRDAMVADDRVTIPRINLGLLLLRLTRYQLAMQVFRQVLDIDSWSAPAWNGVGLVLTEIGRPEDARNAFARAVESDPESAEAHYNLSFALSRLGDYDGALRAVTRAQELDPYYVPQKFRLAIDLQYEDPHIAVVPEISADVTTELAPQSITFDPSLLNNLFAELDQPASGTERRAGDSFALARDYLQKGLLELAAAETNRALGRGADRTEAQVLLGEIYSKRGLHGEALERYRAARETGEDRSDAVLGEVRQLIALGRGAEALADAEILATSDPEDVDVLIALAQARQAAADPAGALQVLTQAREQAPQRPELLKLEGDVAVAMGDLEQAEAAYRGALELDPRFVQVHVALGALYERREDPDAAEAAYRGALGVLPTFSDAALALAGLHRRRGQPRAAVNLLVDVLAADPADVDALQALGQALLDDGRLDDGGAAFDRLLAHDARHIAGLFFSGVVLARQKRYNEAIRRWDHVITLDPSGPYAQRARRHARTALDLRRIFQTEAA